MKADVANFDVYPIPEGFNSDGGYLGRLEGRPTIQLDDILEDAHRLYGSDKKQLRTDFEHVLDLSAQAASDRLANVQLAQYLLLRPFLGGKFLDKRAKFNPKVHKVYLRAICKKELKIDYSKWSFHNNTEGRAMKVSSVNSAGADVDTEIELRLDIEFNGDWLNLLLDRADLEPRDRVTFSCEKPDGTTVAGELETTYSSLHRITCKWPEALDASTVGCAVTFTVHGRCGEDDAVQQQVTTKPVTIVAAAGGGEPEPAGITLTGVHAPGIEPPMIHLESGVWFDGTGLDGWTGGANDEVLAKNNRAEEAEWTRVDLHEDVGGEVVFDGGMLKMDEGVWTILDNLGIVEGSEVRFKVTVAGNSAEIVATVAEA